MEIMPHGRVTSTHPRRQGVGFVAARALMLIALFTGCTSSDFRRESTVVIASGADLESANPLVTVHPLARQVQRYALFVTLTRYDSLLSAQPYFARSWEWSADRRKLTLALFRGLNWHDGQPTTAQDVAFSISAARNPSTGFFRRADLDNIANVAVNNDTSVTIEFRTPELRFPLVFSELPIAPAHILSGVEPSRLRGHDFGFAPVGNGPFRFEERRPRQLWTFVANESFPVELGGPPRIGRLVVAVVDEATTKFAGLVSGELDMAGISPSMAELTERDPQLRVVSYPVAFTTTLVFNAERDPFIDSKVRRAVAASINRQRLIDVALAGFGTAAQGPVPPSHPLARLVKRVPVDAGALLDSAGWRRGADGWRTKDGIPLQFTLETVGSGDNAIEQLIQADLRGQGIRMEIRQLELGTFLASVRAQDKTFDAVIAGIPGDVSLSHVAAMFETSQAGGALDYSGFHDTALDQLFMRARNAAGDAELRAAWAGIEDLLYNQAPVAWLYHSRGVQGVRRALTGVEMDLRGELVSLSAWQLSKTAQ